MLALLAVLVLGAPAAAQAASADDLAASPGSLERVPDRYRPLFRWWWPGEGVDPAELRDELRAVKAAGFAGVEQILLANVTQWGSPTFRERTKSALQEARRLGLRMDITLGPGWPVSSPSVEELGREAAVQDLHYGAVDVRGGTTYSGSVPDSPPVGADRRRLIAATAIRVAGSETPQVLDPGSAVDLTSRVRDGALTWTVPSGRWKLFGFWMRPSLMRGKAPGGGPPGWLVVDHFSRRAIELVLRDFDRMLFGGDMASLVRRSGGDVFEDSYEVEHGPTAEGQSAVFWTPAMLSEFARRRGYALDTAAAGAVRGVHLPG